MQYNHAEEEKTLYFWKKKKILTKIEDRNKDGKKFYFLQGPPYTSGRIHLGQAWNHALKDMVLRYKRMTGHNVWNRAGYDMHGLPTSRKVMAEHKLETKEDIEKFGFEKFTQECIKFSEEKAALMNTDIERIGTTLNFKDPYYPISNNFMEGEWFLIKQADKKKRLYKGKRAAAWCPSCETAVAKHEQQYQNITDNSIFVKMKKKGTDNEYFIIWTTTPWTIPFNLGIMVNPELDYIKAKVKDEIWYLSKQLAPLVVQAVAGEKLEILETFKGEKLDGQEYIHPFYDDLKPIYDDLKKRGERVHTILMSKEYVTTDAGSGLVHCAPGCGPEDYEVGHQYKLPIFNNIDEKGVFPKEMGIFAGKIAKKDDTFFIKRLEELGALVASTPIEHDYAHCERCKSPVVFRTTDQWFFKIEDLKDRMLELNEQVHWVPETANNSYKSWLNNIRDNSITKQRFWGTPVPIWECECGHYEVFGNVEELKKLAITKIPKNLHKPYIDDVKIKCPNCGKEVSRIPDVLDVWIDAGTTSWNCLYYPKREDLFHEWFPANFICEGKDQIRGWFNLLMVASVLAFDKVPFKNVYMHGFVTDVEGEKMSKSLGNIISPYEIIDKHGADVLRYYMCQNNAATDVNFSWDEIALKYRNLLVLWNLHNFLINLAKENNVNPYKLDGKLLQSLFDTPEKYIFSKLHRTIKKVTEYFEKYEVNDTIKPIETLYLELSRTYVQFVRDKASIGTEQDKEVVIYTLAYSLLKILKMFAPVTPFITEKIYQNLKKEFGLEEESIHMYKWPKFDNKFINEKLETSVEIAKSCIGTILNAREKVQIGLRWPLSEAVAVTTDKAITKSLHDLSGLIENQTNIKKLSVMANLPDIKYSVKPDYKKLGPDFGQQTPKIIAELAQTSPEKILEHIEKDGSYNMKLGKEIFEITKQHLVFETEVPHPYSGGDFKFGQVFINQDQDEKLMAEGYTREVIRRIQNLRKDAGLNKSDNINLILYSETDELESYLDDHTDLINNKCGLKDLTFTKTKPVKDHKFSSEEKVKGIKFSLFFD